MSWEQGREGLGEGKGLEEGREGEEEGEGWGGVGGARHTREHNAATRARQLSRRTCAGVQPPRARASKGARVRGGERARERERGR